MISYENFISDIKNLNLDLYKNYPTSNFVTFKAGGYSDIFIVPKDKDSLIKTVLSAKKHNVSYICVGGGSNLIIRDGGYRGVIICTTALNKITHIDNIIIAQSGAKLSAVVSYALSNSLRGFEFAGGIPGTIGGGVFMNAGAYGGEIKDVILSAEVLNDNGEVTVYDIDDLCLGYRHSKIMENGGIVLSVTLKLEKGDELEGRKILKELNAKRREKQPTELPSAGSTFKRPSGYFAAALIDEAGLKGLTVGGAQVSPKHAGFVVNIGGATAKDIEDLTEEIKQRVYNNSGVKLDLEVRIIGERCNEI